MPVEKRFQIGDYWLTQRPGSTKWYAANFDAGSRQTKRTSLGTDDLQVAQIKLAEFVTRNADIRNQPPAEMPLATILVRYWHAHGEKLRSSDQVKAASRLWNDYWKTSTVADLTAKNQNAFKAWLRERDYKNATIARIMGVGRAAVNLAWKNGEITSAPFIINEADRSDEEERYILSMEEMRRLLKAVQEWPHAYVFTMIVLNTLARNEAALDLSPAEVDLKNRLINLNPKGRKQTKKYRPEIPITAALLPFVTNRDVPKFIMWRGKPIKDIGGSFAKAVQAAGLPDAITPYCLRHTMAVELRTRGVPEWEASGLMGHRRPGVTERYAKFRPDYLSLGSKAIDAYFSDLKMVLPVPEYECVPVACQSPDGAVGKAWKYGAAMGI